MEIDVIRKESKSRVSDNIIHKLFDRESGFKYERSNCLELPLHCPIENKFHRSFVPNCTIQNIMKPNVFFRKFTPDGQLLLGISNDQRCVEVWQYTSIGNLANLLQFYDDECILESQLLTLEWEPQPYSIFNRVLKKKYSIRLVQENLTRCQINREFSIFFDINQIKYVIVVSVSMSLNGHAAEMYFRYPDLCDDFDLFHYNFFLINLTTGQISDVKIFNSDYMILTHNHGVSVHNRTLAILSMHRQCVMLYEISDNGKMVPIYEIGPFANSLDELRVTSIPIKFDSLHHEMAYSHFKQRILTYIYNEIDDMEEGEEKRNKLRDFYKRYRTYERMCISKMQLVGTDCILLRYEDRPPAVPSERNRSLINETDFKLYVFYSIATCEIIRIFEKDSVELLHILKDYCDVFRNARSAQTGRPPSSISNDICYREAFDAAILNCGDMQTAALRFNPTLPISSQSFSSSPYLDYGLFNYDDRLIASLERPKFVTTEPIIFTDRLTNKVKFRIFLDQDAVLNTLLTSSHSSTSASGASSASGPASSSTPPSQQNVATTNTSNIGGMNITNQPNGVNIVPHNRDVVFFIFHPFDPFIISMQKCGMKHVLNFHVYNPSTIVAQ